MPSYKQLKGDAKIGWLEKLPKKTQILVLMMIMLAAGVIQLLMGLHSVHTGRDIVLGNKRISAVESFFWCAACLAIVGGLFAVFMGWAKSSKTDPSA